MEFDITEMEKLTIKCAHLEHELTVTRAQAAVDQANTARETAIRTVMSQYIDNSEDFEKYTINLDNNKIVERDSIQDNGQQMPVGAGARPMNEVRRRV
jgi:hypothetical protein